MNAMEFFLAVMGLSARFRFSVQSWGRSVQHNADVGGRDDSMHLYWLAIDCRLDDATQTSSFVSACTRLGLAVLPEAEYLHVQVPRIRDG